jgi:exopolysaccharide biosynthesis predicted pyruvyltransferase EpsI
MVLDAPLSFDQGKQKILDAIGEPRDLTFIRGFGNIGDLLIHAGIRRLLASLDYREVSVLDLRNARGHTAVFPGAGGFCHAHHKIPAYMADIESRFEHVIILPSSFDVSVDSVRAYLQGTRAHVFARERESYYQTRGLCRADLAHDCAFYFDFNSYKRPGKGTLTACRTDRESAIPALPVGNVDLSDTCETLDEFLWTIARHELIRTDRAHVMIAAAMLGKRVEYWSSNYHKLPAIAEFSLANFPVCQINPGKITEENHPASTVTTSHRADNNPPRYNYWPQWVHLAALELAEVIPVLSTCILIDDVQLGDLPVYNRLFLPFLERDGQYCGSPADSRQAIAELERLRGGGATYLAVAWTAFWWLDNYGDFFQYLRSRYSCRLENERVIIFDLQSHATV